MAEPADPRLGSEIAGYRIEEHIGRGGMGVVYRAQHMNLQRRAAIKIIAPEFADTKGFHSRFIREARIAAALQHPNIVTVYDAGQAGETLTSRCSSSAARTSPRPSGRRGGCAPT